MVTLKALLQQGSDIHMLGFRNNTLLHTAAENGYEAMVLFLLQQGIPVNARNACDETPLYLAVLNKHKGVVKILMEHGADDAVQNINRNNAVDVVVKRFGASLPYKKIAALLHASPTPEI
jgi:ankyrin repeat protein